MTRYFLLLCSVIIFASCRKHAVSSPGWVLFTENDSPVFRGQYPLVGDPAVIRDGEMLRMFYTGFDAYRSPQGPEICAATSADGLSWTNIPSTGLVQGRVLYTNSNTWSSAHETSFALKTKSGFNLYFIGYKDSGGGVFASGPVSIGLATSPDGVRFDCLADPVLVSSATGLDRDALSSPTITTYQDSLVMIYAGFCYSGCGPAVVSSLLAATSADGLHWTKRTDPVIATAEVPWASQGVAEAELVLAPDKMYYLFMTSVNAPQEIGVARSVTPFGPWEVNPLPIIRADKPFSVNGAVAPSVLIENGRVRLWYHGFSSGKIQVGYAESAWPLMK